MVGQIINYFKEEFDIVADSEKSIQMKAYMKNKFEFYGIPSPLRKDIIKYSFQKFTIKNESDLLELVNNLWNLPEREYQYVAVEYLYKYRKLISENAISHFENLIVTKSWWDTVDTLAADMVGDFYIKFPEIRERQIELWLQSGNIWLQRVCIIHQLFHKEKTDLLLLEKCILHCKDSNEFFIQKAIGWALRQHARIDPSFVSDFVNNNMLKPLSRREAMKHLGTSKNPKY